MSSRRFKVKMRSGATLIRLTKDGSESPQVAPHEKVVVDVHTAARLVRNRTAEVVEVIEAFADSSAAS
jgi:hypothetical protein